MSSEFTLINDYFHWDTRHPSVLMGVGDDAAILQPPEKKHLIVSSDTFIEGVHFPKGTAAHAIGHKALAVNLSDLAAMGADPAWFTLALTLPEVDDTWLHDFSSGLKELANQFSIDLVGGDTTRGSLSITITAIGFADEKQVLQRSTAVAGDSIYVTGELGAAAAGLAHLQERVQLDERTAEQCQQQLDYPIPRNAESVIIRKFASSCIDISDGFLADLQHILDASELGAVIQLQDLPIMKSLKSYDSTEIQNFALRGGDDYELLFTIPETNVDAFEQAIQQSNMMCYCVGHIDAAIHGIQSDNQQVLSATGYNHFNENTS
ncbi:MAG: Thiamine-monophosphate kinase (EC [uncultured Thiotrichaceae bacterium]|uniref:Thiamine-monophosphate kinase n=1 Tax=uncultured Thiotrichaceae bacterium TaxID=298394 RepID=A0A6S6UAE8_9GAMM|nr:MAG: Thiamine-monophosphate kinase (EC [uncultured Thiotrichaceae bacterium]